MVAISNTCIDMFTFARAHTLCAQTWQKRSSEARPPGASPLTQRLIINLIMFSQSCFLITLILLCAWTGWGLMSSGTVEQGWAPSWTLTELQLFSFSVWNSVNLSIVWLAGLHSVILTHANQQEVWHLSITHLCQNTVDFWFRVQGRILYDWLEDYTVDFYGEQCEASISLILFSDCLRHTHLMPDHDWFGTCSQCSKQHRATWRFSARLQQV